MRPNQTASSLYKVGERIQARWRGGRQWYPGKIFACNADGTFRVAYDDGGREPFVSAALIRRSAETYDSPVVIDVRDLTETGGEGRALFQSLITPEGVEEGGGEDDEEVHAECMVCFEELHSKPVGVFCCASEQCGKRNKQRRYFRSCPHMLHLECARTLSADAGCPLCRSRFDVIARVPTLDGTNTRKWFATLDTGGDGQLTKLDVREALKAQLPVNQRRLERHFSKLWLQWDVDGSGTLNVDEITHPSGLMACVLAE